MRVLSRLSGVLAIVCCSTLGLAADVKFSRMPSVSKRGDRTIISFAISQPTDVEVAVLDAQDKVVRHLAAGVLGAQTPPPAPLKRGLSQTLEWDGRDDSGKSVATGAFKVRIRAGLGVHFGRFIGGDPYLVGKPDSIATSESGNVYALGYQGLKNQNFRTLRTFSPEGAYLGTVMPFPADLKSQAMKDVATWDRTRKAFCPRNLASLNPEFYTLTKNHLVSVSKRRGILFSDGTNLYRLDLVGSVPGEQFLWRKLWQQDQWKWHDPPNSGGGPVFVALSPDDKYIYLSGPFSAKTKYGHKFNPQLPPGRIYRMRLDRADTMQPFVTIPVEHQAGVGGNWTRSQRPEHFTVPHGPVHQVAIDAKGNVYVADREHNRIAVFNQDGQDIGGIPVMYPDLVAVHPRSGVIYVLQKDCIAYHRFQKVLFKFDSFQEGVKPAAKYEFPLTGNWPTMALSVAGDRTVLWFAGMDEAGGLMALEDKGSQFVPVTTDFSARPGAQEMFSRIAVDPVRDEVYISDGVTRIWRYDGLTGNGEMLTRNGKPFIATDLSVGYDGLLYVRTGARLNSSYSGPLERLTHTLEPAPYPQTGSHVLSKYIYSRYGVGFAERGIGVGPAGEVYVNFMYDWAKYLVAGFRPDSTPMSGSYMHGAFNTDHYDRGMPRKLDSAIIGPIPSANGGMRVDLKGDIYVGMRLLPEEFTYPAGYEEDPAYRKCTGSVVKFTPAGGRVIGAKELATTDRHLLRMDRGMVAAGGIKAYPGMAPYSGSFGGSGCVCRSPRFDIDRYGRLVIPNAITNSVTIVDNAGNEILGFGAYGNFDSQYRTSHPSKAKVPVPEIPLAWPTGAGFSGKYIYVSDTYNRRVVRVDVAYTCERVCSVK